MLQKMCPNIVFCRIELFHIYFTFFHVYFILFLIFTFWTSGLGFRVLNLEINEKSCRAYFLHLFHSDFTFWHFEKTFSLGRCILGTFWRFSMSFSCWRFSTSFSCGRRILDTFWCFWMPFSWGRRILATSPHPPSPWPKWNLSWVDDPPFWHIGTLGFWHFDMLAFLKLVINPLRNFSTWLSTRFATSRSRKVKQRRSRTTFLNSLHPSR